MKLGEFIKGLQLMAPYFDEGLEQSYFMGGEHDQIYFYVDAATLPEDSVSGKQLIELGFFVDEDVENWSLYT